MNYRGIVSQIGGICAAVVLLASCSNQNTSTSLDPSIDPRAGGGCTSIMVGRQATTDGSVITSHTCDGFYRTWIAVSPHRMNSADATEKIYLGRRYRPVNPDDVENLEVAGEIPEIEESYAFLDTAYPCINEHQLAIGESTLFTREELRDTEKGLFEIEEIQRLMLERCRTAREAIHLADDLTERYGYRGYFGECLTIADPKEVWHFEIVGATSKYVGAVWAAVRIPDGHVGVSANFPRIGELDLDSPDYFMASENVYSLAEEMGWWDPGSGKPFKFYEAYGNRRKNISDREWRILSLAAPSLNLDPDADEIPFSVEAEHKVSVRDVIAWFRDTYENTRFDPTQNLIVTNRKGTKFVSPVASPWMSLYMENLLNTLKPGSVPPVYIIPNNTCSYSTVIQLRDWLPDQVGGIVWLNFDNPAHCARMPLYCGITGLPAHFKVCGQDRFTTESALWAFRRVSRLAGVNWGASRQLVESLIQECEDQAFAEIPGIEKMALELYESDPESARAFLTSYCGNFAQAVTQRYWDLGDQLWTLFGRDFLFTPEQIESMR